MNDEKSTNDNDSYDNESIISNYSYSFNDDNIFKGSLRYSNSFLNYDEVTSGRNDSNNSSQDNELSYNLAYINNLGNFKNSLIAYEPIWSIGTGKIPSVFEIQEMHTHIKKIIFKILNKRIKVLYGGSVNTKNIDDILNITNVDGVLVGGASLEAKDFLAIYSAAVKHLRVSSLLQDIK